MTQTKSAKKKSRWGRKLKLKVKRTRLIVRRRKQKVSRSKSFEVRTPPLQLNAHSTKSHTGHSGAGVTVASKPEPQDSSTGA